MEKLLRCANAYLAVRDWKLMAMVKFCVASLGLLLGLRTPAKHRKKAAAGALAVFALTYVPLMADFLHFAAGYLGTGKTRGK